VGGAPSLAGRDACARATVARGRARGPPAADAALERAFHLRRVPSARVLDSGAVTMAAIRLPRWLGGVKRVEHRLRFGYLRALPAPLLPFVDPPLRRLAAFGRRAAATPINLRHPLARWQGDPGRVAVWSARYAPQTLFDVLFDEPPARTEGGTLGLAGMMRHASSLHADCDLLIAHTTPALAPWLRRAGFVIVPGMVRFGGDPEALLAALEKLTNTSALAGDFRRMRRTHYRVERWTHTPERSRLFYERYLRPHAQVRFGDRGEIGSFVAMDRIFAGGLALAVIAPDRDEPDAIGLVVPRGTSLWCVNLGTRDGDRAILRAGGLAALYLAQIRFAHELGVAIDFGRCLPWASDGIFQYKWKWGLRPIPDGLQTLELAVKVLRPDSLPARRLVERGVIVREGRSFRQITADDLGAE